MPPSSAPPRRTTPPSAAAVAVGVAGAGAAIASGLLLRRKRRVAAHAREAELEGVASRLGLRFVGSGAALLEPRLRGCRPFTGHRGVVDVRCIVEATGDTFLQLEVVSHRRNRADFVRQYIARSAQAPDFHLRPLARHEFLPRHPGPPPQGMSRVVLPPTLSDDYALFVALPPAPQALVDALARGIGDEKDWYVDGDAGLIVAGHPALLRVDDLARDMARFRHVVQVVDEAFASGSKEGSSVV